MLFAQKITLHYRKDARTPQCAQQRKTVRFRALPDDPPPEQAVFLHDVFLYQTPAGITCQRDRLTTYGADAFYAGGFNTTPFARRLAVCREGDCFPVKYCGSTDRGFLRTVLTLRPGESGRVLLNRRGTYEDTGIWFYEEIIWNFVSAPYSAYRAKLFFRKQPDHIFEDLQALHYCG